MSDTTYNKFQHYGTNAERLAFVPSPPAATQPIYIWYETDTGKVFLYHTTWIQLAGIGTSIVAHATTHEAGGTDEVTLAQSQITNLTTDLAAKADLTDPRFTDARTPLAHAPSHISGGSDPLSVITLAGYPGGTTDFLRADGTFAVPPVGVTTIRRQITLMIDGGGSVITAGFKTYLSIPVAGTIQKWRILADVSGSIVVDVWKDVFASYPPTVADTITAAAKPTLSGALTAESSTLTGWTTAFSAGDVMGFNVDSVASVKKISLVLEFE